jgi:cell division protein FtsL
MPLSTDRELQARLLKETSELYARKQKLEDDIRNLDAVNNSLQDTAAIRDIEAYKSRLPVSAKLPYR